jgi:hypothetical protein
LIPLLGVADGDDIPARIAARQPPGVAPLNAPQTAGPAEGHKTRPMCAEPVRAAGHKFDNAAAKPA